MATTKPKPKPAGDDKFDPRAERARLEQEVRNCEASEGRARADLRNAEQSLEPLERELLSARAHFARSGGANGEEVAAIERDISDTQRSALACEAQQHAAAKGKRDAQTELHVLLRDWLPVFYTDACELATIAEVRLRALGPALDEAARAWQAAALEFSRLNSAAREVLVDRDRERDHWPPAHDYNRRLRIEPFPFDLGVTAKKARPEAVEIILNPEPRRG